MEHDTVHDNEEAEKKINKKPTTLVADTKQYEEVLSETFDSNSAEEADTELERNANTDTDL